MRLKWITVPAFLAGLLTLATVDSQGQPPGFGGRDRGGDGDRGDRGRRGFSMDPNAMWDRFSRGQDSINLNDPQHSFMKRMMERRGEPMPPNGILTKQQFVAGMQQRMAQRGSDGGSPGRFTPPGGSNARTYQRIPGPDGKSVVVMPSGSSNSSDRATETFFRMSDRNRDGKLDRDEARGGLRDRFEQYDSNRDGTIDANEYRPYIQERMGNRGSSNSSDSRGRSSSSSGRNQNSRSNSKDKDDEEERPVVYRYGKLPKGLPSWFEELDTDQDGQVGLYEWRRNSKPTSEFVDFDLNADGYLTAGEWLRHEKLAIERRATESASVSFGAPGQTGGVRVQLQADGKKERGDRPRRPSREERREEKKRNPFMGN